MFNQPLDSRGIVGAACDPPLLLGVIAFWSRVILVADRAPLVTATVTLPQIMKDNVARGVGGHIDPTHDNRRCLERIKAKQAKAIALRTKHGNLVLF